MTTNAQSRNQTACRSRYLSYSRLSRYERCPKSYELHYIQGLRPAPNDSLKFGSLLHLTLENYYRRCAETGWTGKIDHQDLARIFKALWSSSGLAGIELFDEGHRILAGYAADVKTIDPAAVLAIEQEIDFKVGDYRVKGFIDRIDRLDDGTIEVVDYKTNRMLFSREEADRDLQLLIYCMAARELYPEHPDVKLSLYMLRHRFKMTTQRSDEDLQVARDYIQTLGRQMETAAEFPARLNAFCPWCDHRAHCGDYQLAFLDGQEFAVEDDADLDKVAQMRERAANVAKIAYARKRELEDIIKAHVEHNGAFTANGLEYSMSRVSKLSYPVGPTLRRLSETTGRDMVDLAQELLSVDPKKLEALLKTIKPDMPAPEFKFLKTQLDAGAEESFSQRFSARKAGRRHED